MWRSSACCAYCALGRVNATDHLRFFFTRTKLSDNRAHDSIPQPPLLQAPDPPRSLQRWRWCPMLSRWPPRRAPRLRASCGKQASSAPKYTAVLEDAHSRSGGPTARRSGKPCSPPLLAQRRLTPSMPPLSTPSETLPEVCVTTIDINIGREHQTPNTHVSNTLLKNAWHTTRERRRARCLGHLHIDDRRFA